MATQIILIIILVIVIILFIVLFRKKSIEKVIGICEVALEQKSQKEENKQKILELLKNQNNLSNSDIREKLGFSERSVVRYCEELEKENKIEQVGITGRNVTYRVKSEDHATGRLKP